MNKSKLFLLAPTLEGKREEIRGTLISAQGFNGPIFKGDGPINVCCGKCHNILAEGGYADSISNMALECPKCLSVNIILKMSELKEFFVQLKAHQNTISDLPDLADLLKSAQLNQRSPSEISESIQVALPDFSWVNSLLIPKNAGEFYGLVAIIIAIITWLNPRQAVTSSAEDLFKKYAQDQDPYRKSGVNQKCPCGSGRKFKKCHGVNV